MRADEGLLILSRDGRIQSANKAASKLLGFSKDEFRSMALPLLREAPNGAGSIGPVASAFQAILAEEVEEAEGDARFLTKQEQRIAVHWKLWALPPAAHDRNVLLSISETAQASDEGVITAGYRDVFEYAVEGIFRTSLDGRYLEVNPALAKMYGYASAADLIQSVRDLNTQLYVDPNRRAEFVRIIDEQGVVSGLESEVYTATGSVIWIAEYARLVRARDGRPLYYEGSVIDVTTQKDAEAAIKRSQEKFRHLAERTKVVPWEADSQTGTFTYVGPQAARLLACTTEDWLSPGFWARQVHPDDREWVPTFRQEAIEKRQEFECEYRLFRFDGKEVWVREIVSVLPDSDTSSLMGGFIMDVTHRRHAEESLRESQHFIEQLASASPTILYLYDPFMRQCLHLNGRVLPILGYSREALEEIHPFFIEALAHPEELHSHYEHFERLRQSPPDAVIEREFRMRSATGSWVWLHSRECVYKRDFDGLPNRVVGTLEDITSHRSAMDELEANETLFRRLAETTNVIPFDFDAGSGRFTYIGPQAERFLGYPVPHWYTRDSWLQMIHPEDILEGTRFAAENYESPGNYQAEFRLISSSKQTIWVRQIFSRDAEDDQRIHVRGFLIDITESKKLEAEREQSRAELRELAARGQSAREEERMNIAREIHDELGQALTMIKLDLTWLSSRVAKETSLPELQPIAMKLGSMEQTIASTLQTVRRVLSALRPPLLDELGLAEAIEWHASEFARRAALRCEIKVEGESDVPIEPALAVFRIFQEITTNIARHSKATRVTIELRFAPTGITLLVVDNGRGIAESEMKKKGHYGLLGMHERAWAFGGQIWLESSPGKGTSVRVELPLNKERPPTDAPPAGNGAAPHNVPQALAQ